MHFDANLNKVGRKTKKVIEVWNFQNYFYDRRHFEYLIRLLRHKA